MNDNIPEETLDPEDWESMRALGHRMLDDMLDHVRTIREQPAWRHAPDEAKAHFTAPLPQSPQNPDEIYQEFLDYVLPYPIGNTHPRFWGWFFGTGTVMGAYAELLAGTMNTNAGDLDHHSAIHVDKQVLDWLKEMLVYPSEASGLITSGCSAANLIGLTVARSAKAGFDIRREGLAGSPGEMVLYASTEIHSSVQKAVEMLGMGSQALRLIPVDYDFRININALKEMVHLNRAAGFQPFCVVGAAGTVNTGAFDDLEALADICQEEGLWLHVDGAFGAWTALVPEEKHLVAGMERAHSLAFDLHKWMYMQYEIGCIFVKDANAHRAAFSLTPVYLESTADGRGLTGGDLPWYTDFGFQLSRKFASLKAWMEIKQHGVGKYSRMIQQNIDQARYLATLVENDSGLELAAPAPSIVVCFRYMSPGLDTESLNTINKQILVELQEQGIAVPSGTTLGGKYVLRVGITNHRSRREDFDILVQEVLRLGDELVNH